MISHVPPEQVPLVWPQIEPMVQRGLRHGEGDCLKDIHIKSGVLSGAMQMWAVHDETSIIAAVVLRVVQHPNKRTLFVVMLAGKNHHLWADEMEQLLLDYKDIIGADTIEASCNHPMARSLMRRGWKHKASIMQAPERI